MNINNLPVVIKRDIPTTRLPVQYETACKALAECVNLDEAKLWSDKAEALKVWARIYKDDRAAVEAKRLKLRAYRRMGELAEELQPSHRPRGTGISGTAPGPAALLRSHGLKSGEASAARSLHKMPENKFERMIERVNPPTPMMASLERRGWSDTWRAFSIPGTGFRSFCRKHDPRAVVKGLRPYEAESARKMAQEISDWLDEFERRLPKTKGSKAA